MASRAGGRSKSAVRITIPPLHEASESTLRVVLDLEMAAYDQAVDEQRSLKSKMATTVGLVSVAAAALIASGYRVSPMAFPAFLMVLGMACSSAAFFPVWGRTALAPGTALERFLYLPPKAAAALAAYAYTNATIDTRRSSRTIATSLRFGVLFSLLSLVGALIALLFKWGAAGQLLIGVPVVIFHWWVAGILGAKVE